ncbi:BTAD domain-containing putative transcriptional regulator [Streptomyces sp. NPDC006134]|uniref:AfsR/SARP family transcriptional regulator n=1 Tax=Streptomyces sp. NPDC006134 TaxID=3154467 RepID=UPI0033E2FC61
MSERVSFGVLGPLEVRAGERRLRLGGTVPTRILTTLLLSPGQMLPVSRLVEAAWDEDPPATAAHQVRKTVSDLRQRIPEGSTLIITDGPGYRIEVAPDQLDLSQFSGRLQQAREAAVGGRTADAAEQLRAALALWRGPAPDASSGSLIAAGFAVLNERRLVAVGQLVDLRLGLGEHEELVGDLRELTAQHPLREDFRGQLMLALYRSGRQAEALGEYATLRELLMEELGVYPGRQLGGLYEAILRGGPELLAPERAPKEEVPRLEAPEQEAAVLEEPAAPCTLPHDLTDFTGRERELAALLAEGDSTGPRIVAIDGMGGSGKTALAVRAAHRLAEHYPDGRLHTDLRGFSPGQEPRDPGTVIAALLRTLGVPGERIPEDIDGRTALWRATLSGRRVLLVLDNAADASQVRPLLPASAGCLALITSRIRMSGLDGTESVTLDVLSASDSLALLTAALGEERAGAEPAATAALAELCGYLPLALRVAAARLRSRPRWTVQYLVVRLRDEARRLDELRSGDRSVEATLRLSRQAMDAEHRTALRLLGLHPGVDFDVPAAAALLALPRPEAEDVLEHFLDVHLLEQHEMGRCSFHDLVRRFVRRLPQEEGETAAFERLLDHYLATTDEACRILFPSRGTDPQRSPRFAEPPVITTPEQAAGFFDRERGTLLAVVRRAADEGFDLQVARLARNLLFHFNSRSLLQEYEEAARLAVTAARRCGDRAELCRSLSNLASGLWKLGRFDDGIAAESEALEIARRLGNLAGEASCLDTLGLFHGCLGDLAAALRLLERSVELYAGLPPSRQAAYAYCNLSTVYTWLGRSADAVKTAEQAVRLSRLHGAPGEEIAALNDLAIAQLDLGDLEAARSAAVQALETGDENRVPEDLALALAVASEVLARLGAWARSDACAKRSLELARSKGTPLRQAMVENILGRLRGSEGDHRQALALHRSAYAHAQTIGYPIESAQACAGIAAALAALGDEDGARTHRTRAEALVAGMTVPPGQSAPVLRS